VHRDVKPENVLLDGEGNAYLTDFGIAKDVSNPRATETGPLGTPVYLSPEQIRGEPVSPRTDVYALGVLIYEALTGRQPFPDGSIAALLQKNLHDPLPSVRESRPELPGTIDEVLARATAKDPAARFDDVGAFAAAFRAAIGPAGDGAVIEADRPNPFKGLRPFVEADAEDFFGREALVERLVGRLAEEVDGSRFLVVVGASGSGKSSAVRAGLVPALRRGALVGSADWFYVEMAPGAHPLEELEAALLRVAVKAPASILELLEGDELGLHHAVLQTLPDDDSQLVLVLDQLEEVFTLVEEERERRAFLDRVRAAVTVPGSRLVVVATLRADFYDRPLAYRGLAELVRARTEPIVPLSPEELERAIAGPAENVGVTVEPALVAQVAVDVSEQPGSLPLLQYAMTEVFEARTDGVLSAQAYREIGGVSGALARRAEQLFGGLDTSGKLAAEQLFLRLVALGEGTEDTRRRVGRSELDRIGVDGRALEGVIEAYGRHRLLSLDRDPDTREPSVEVAHEALLREWSRLRGWIDSAREDLRAERRLAAAAAEWVAAGRDPSFLLRGARLEQVSAWAGATSLALARSEREYLDESTAVAEGERAAEEARVERERRLERRSVRRLRTAVAVFAVAALVAAGLTVVATQQSERAEAEAREASARELAAAAVANLERDPQLSILLAIEAVERTHSVDGSVLREAEEALHQAVTASRIVTSVPGSSEDWDEELERGDDGNAVDWGRGGLVVVNGEFASEGPRPVGMVDLRDPATGKIVRSFPAHGETITGAVFSPDGLRLATTAMDGLLKVWDLSSGDVIRTVRGGPDAWAPSFSADGTRVAAAFGQITSTDSAVIRVADLSADPALTFPVETSVIDVALSPEGRRLVVVSGFTGQPITLIDVDTSEVREVANPIVHSLESVAWSPDGRHIAAGSLDSSVALMDADGRFESMLEGHSGSASWVEWGPEPSRLLTGSKDGTAKIWAITREGTGTELLTLPALAGEVTGVAFSPDGTQVLTRSETRVMDVWDVGPAGDAEVANVAGAGIVSFTSQRLVTNGPDASLSSLDMGTGERTHSPVGWYEPPRGVYSYFDFAPDGGSLLVSAYFDGLTIRDVETGDDLFSSSAEEGGNGSDWSPDGRFVALNSGGSITVVDASGRVIARLPEDGSTFTYGVSFGPGGLIAVPAFDEELGGHMKIWDWTRDEIVAEFPAPYAEDEVMRFDHRGGRIALGTPDTTIWDVRTGRLLLTLPSRQSGAADVAFSPDEDRLAVMDADGTVRLFDMTSGEEVLVLRGHAAGGQVVFSPDGSMLATQGGGMVRIWALDVDDLLEIANENVTRSLTDEECRRYLHIEACSVAPAGDP
jgi:WD40 repeat protein